MQPKNPRHAAVMKATLAAYDTGTRGGDLIAVFVDTADEQRSAASLPPINTAFATGILLESATGGTRAELEKALHGFNI